MQSNRKNVLTVEEVAQLLGVPATVIRKSIGPLEDDD